MSKDDNSHIKLELNKNNSSGKIDIVAHFKNDAPNVIIENGEYVWLPTIEEKDLLNEAFSLLSSKSSHTVQPKTDTSSSKTKEEPSPPTKTQPSPDIKEPPKQKVQAEDTSQDFPDTSDKEIKEPAVFKVTKEEDKKSYDDETKDQKEESEKEEEEEEDDAVIVKADSEAIENALKKHQKKDEDDDDTIVEADEKTIIDRVLKQKKKGKWKK